MERRKFLGAVPFAVGGGLALAAEGASAQSSSSSFINVKSYGATGNGTTDDTAAIQSAINYCINGGNSLYFPAGTYLVSSQLNVTGTINIFGDGIYRDVANPPTAGTIIMCNFAGNGQNGVFYVTGNSASFSDIEVTCRYQPADGSGWSPATTPACFYVYCAPYADSGETPKFHNVMCRGMSSGIVTHGATRLRADYIFGYTYGPLIQIDGSYDVVQVTNVHYWPFVNGSNIANWVQTYVSAIDLGRVDNPNFSNIFIYGANRGIQFRDSASGINPPGGVSRSQWNNVGLDNVCYGVIAQSSSYSHQAQFSNLYIYNAAPAGASIYSGSRGIWATGSTTFRLEASNVYLTGSQLEAIRIEVSGSVVSLSGLQVDSYNQLSGNNAAAVWIGNGVSLHSGPYNIAGAGAGSVGPFSNQASGVYDIAAGRTISVANPGYEQYTAVINGIPRTVTRNFGRVAVNITGPGYVNWEVGLPVAVNFGVISCNASMGNLNANGIVDIYDGRAWSSIGGQTAATGTIYTSLSSGTQYVDWEVVGY